MATQLRPVATTPLINHLIGIREAVRAHLELDQRDKIDVMFVGGELTVHVPINGHDQATLAAYKLRALSEPQITDTRVLALSPMRKVVVATVSA